ncbi:hypothetical protein IAT40_002161 [Kwoniella sp. CBS 6097]
MGTSETSEPAKLFEGCIFYVYDLEKEKEEIERWLINNTAGAITHAASSASYILTKSEDAFRVAHQVGGPLQEKVIRIDWVEECLNAGEYTSRGYWWGLPRVLKLSLPRPKPEQSGLFLSSITRGPPSINPLGAQSSCPTVPVLPASIKPNPTPAPSRTPEEAVQASTATITYTSNSVHGRYRTRRSFRRIFSFYDSPARTWRDRQSPIHGPTPAPTLPKPTNTVTLCQDQERVTKTIDPRNYPLPRRHIGESLTPALSPFPPHPELVPQMKELFRGNTFFISAGRFTRSNVQPKIEALSGRTTEHLDKATRVIFAKTTDIIYINRRREDLERALESGKPAISEDWVHECHSTNDIHDWRPYKVFEIDEYGHLVTKDSTGTITVPGTLPAQLIDRSQRKDSTSLNMPQTATQSPARATSPRVPAADLRAYAQSIKSQEDRDNVGAILPCVIAHKDSAVPPDPVPPSLSVPTADEADDDADLADLFSEDDNVGSGEFEEDDYFEILEHMNPRGKDEAQASTIVQVKQEQGAARDFSGSRGTSALLPNSTPTQELGSPRPNKRKAVGHPNSSRDREKRDEPQKRPRNLTEIERGDEEEFERMYHVLTTVGNARTWTTGIWNFLRDDRMRSKYKINEKIFVKYRPIYEKRNPNLRDQFRKSKK